MANVLVNTLRYHASVSQPVVNVFVHTMNRFDGCGHQFSFAIGYTACRLMCCDRLQLITYSTTFYSTTYYPTIVSSVSHCVMSFPLVFLVFSAPNSKNHAFFQCANMVTASYNSQVSTHNTKSCPLWEFIMKLCWVISFFFSNTSLFYRWNKLPVTNFWNFVLMMRTATMPIFAHAWVLYMCVFACMCTGFNFQAKKAVAIYFSLVSQPSLVIFKYMLSIYKYVFACWFSIESIEFSW